jgi:hypothetical protein
VSLAELLVVLAVIGILAGLALPGITRLNNNARDNMGRAAREVFSLLRAAKIYAATYNVDTAVVYSPQDLNPPSPGVASTSTIRRVGALGMFFKPLQPPPSMNECVGCYIPVAEQADTFQQLPQDTTIFLESVVVQDVLGVDDYNRGELLYQRFTFGDLSLPQDIVYRELGMKGIKVGALESRETEPAGEIYEVYAPMIRTDGTPSDFPAHIFKPSGRIEWSASKERTRIYVAPSPELPQDQREGVLEDGDRTGLVATPIDLYRSTGRVKIAS